MTEEILDEPLFTEEQHKQILEAVSWWEQQRGLFNMAVGITGLLSCMAFLGLNMFYPIYLVNALIYGLLANVCYTASWGCEVLFFYYISRDYSLAPFRLPLFALGTLGSIILTALLAFLIIAIITAPF